MLVVNTKYQAPSYQELAEPLIQMTQAQRAMETAYESLGDKTQSWANKLNPTLDQNAIEAIQNYNKGLASSADLLMSKGLNNGSYKDILNLKRDYNSIIAPLQEKFDFRAKQAEQQRLLAAQNPTMLFNTDYAKTPLDQIKVGEYGDMYNAAPIIKMVGDDLTKYAQSIYTEGKFKSDPIFQGTVVDRVNMKGLTAELVRVALNNPNSKYGKEVQNIIKKGLDASGVMQWQGNNAINAQKKLINLLELTTANLYGTPEHESKNNPAAEKALDYYYQSKLNKEKYEMALEQSKAKDNQILGNTPTIDIGVDRASYDPKNILNIYNEINKGYYGRYGEVLSRGKYGEMLSNAEMSDKTNTWLSSHSYINKKYSAWLKNHSDIKGSTATKYNMFTRDLYRKKDNDWVAASKSDYISKQTQLISDLKRAGIDRIVDSKFALNDLITRGNKGTVQAKLIGVSPSNIADAINKFSGNTQIKELSTSKINKNGGLSLEEKAVNKNTLLDYIKKNPHKARMYQGTDANADKIIIDVEYKDGRKRYIFKNNMNGNNATINTEESFGKYNYRINLLRTKLKNGEISKDEEEELAKYMTTENSLFEDTYRYLRSLNETNYKDNDEQELQEY